MPRVSGKIDGLAPLLRALDECDKKVRNKALRKGVTAADKLVLKGAKARVPVDQGWLKKAIGDRVRTYRRSAKVIGLVGPRTGFSGRGKRRKITKLGEKLSAAGVKPTKYAHLVEFGTRPRVTKAGKFCGQVAPRPFLRPALEANRAYCEAAIALAIREALGL